MISEREKAAWCKTQRPPSGEIQGMSGRVYTARQGFQGSGDQLALQFFCSVAYFMIFEAVSLEIQNYDS